MCLCLGLGELSVGMCVHCKHVSVSLPNEAMALCPGPKVPNEDDVTECPTGLGSGQSEDPGHPQQPRKLCSLAVSWACPHRSPDPSFPKAEPTAPWERGGTSCLWPGIFWGWSPPWSLRLPAPARGTDPADQGWHIHGLLPAGREDSE